MVDKDNHFKSFLREFFSSNTDSQSSFANYALHSKICNRLNIEHLAVHHNICAVYIIIH